VERNQNTKTGVHVTNLPRQRHSPCLGVCQIDEDTGFCRGCARTRSEVATWLSLTDLARDEVWAKLPERLSLLSIRVRLLPWTAEEIAAWVVATMTGRRGTWVTGMPGAVAEFPCREGRDVSAELKEDVVIGRAPDALFRLRVHDKLRAFTFAEDGPVVLGLPKARLTLPVASALTVLGKDRGAIDAMHLEHTLFDFGLGRRCSRFCVRTDGKLARKLQALAGQPWSGVLEQMGMAIIAESPARVVESELSRIEVFSLIPRAGENSPVGAHTHFLPQILTAGDEIPPALALPDYAAPVAIFYPGKPPA
jgi:predicted Fe-S protein YdhL (DUF1289 family)